MDTPLHGCWRCQVRSRRKGLFRAAPLLLPAKQQWCHVSGVSKERADYLKVFVKLIVAGSWLTAQRGMPATQTRTWSSAKATLFRGLKQDGRVVRSSPVVEEGEGREAEEHSLSQSTATNVAEKLKRITGITCTYRNRKTKEATMFKICVLAIELILEIWHYLNR